MAATAALRPLAVSRLTSRVDPSPSYPAPVAERSVLLRDPKDVALWRPTTAYTALPSSDGPIAAWAQSSGLTILARRLCNQDDMC